MGQAYIMKSMDAYFLMYEKALAHGKKPGDSMQAEFEEVAKEHPEWFEYIGEVDKDVDQITGDLREKGMKIFNPHEVDRRTEQERSKDA